MTVTTWKTILLGTGLRFGDDFIQALSDGGFNVPVHKFSGFPSFGDVGDIITTPEFVASVQDAETEIDLVAVSVMELGFAEAGRENLDGATLAKIYERVVSLGLSLCPAEVGPQLRMQYLDQPNRLGICVGMLPIHDSEQCPRIFTVSSNEGSGMIRWCEKGKILDTTGATMDRFFYGTTRFVFVQPRSGAG